jgi:hypothetical protein
VEQLLVTIENNPNDVVAVVSAEHRVKPGDVIDLKLPLERLHLFDAESGDALAASMAAATT